MNKLPKPAYFASTKIEGHVVSGDTYFSAAPWFKANLDVPLYTQEQLLSYVEELKRKIERLENE